MEGNFKEAWHSKYRCRAFFVHPSKNTFTANVTDGLPDTFAIVIKKSDGTTYYSAGTKSISGGDLVIQ